MVPLLNGGYIVKFLHCSKSGYGQVFFAFKWIVFKVKGGGYSVIFEKGGF
jgi:hypothetical protein